MRRSTPIYMFFIPYTNFYMKKSVHVSELTFSVPSKESGLEVMGGDSGYVIMSGTTVLAKISLEKDVIQLTLIP